MVHWESQATAAASSGLLDKADLLVQAADAVRAGGAAQASVVGHTYVSGGLAEFAAYWAPFLAATATAAETLAGRITTAGAAIQALDADLATGAEGLR